jgi:dCTP diphosphatase
MNNSITSLDILKKKVLPFVEDRDWQELQTPKNLSTALSVKVAELMEIFMYYQSQESVQTLSQKKEALEGKIGDIVSFLSSFCNFYNIQVTKVMEGKSKLNERNYPVKKSKESSTRYNDI